MKLKMGLAASLFVLVGASFWIGCGGNACDDAASHEADCLMVSATSGGSTGSSQECTGSVEKAAACINAADCDTIKAALSGDVKKGKSLLDCLAKAGGG